MRLLIVEDDEVLRSQLATQFAEQGFVVDAATDGEEAVYYGCEFDYDVAIVDLGLPKLDGVEVIRRWRSSDVSMPILVLTARDAWQDKVAGLEAGADDYVTKPFHVEEVLARINALVRRAAGMASPVLALDGFELDTGAREVRRDGERLTLTAFEYRVLEYLMLNRDRVISKEELTERLYAQDFERDSNTIEVFIGRLRKKLDPDGSRQPIRTVRGQGYQFRCRQA